MKYWILFFLIGLISCGSNDQQKQADSTESNKNVSNGETLFNNNCANCHKPNIDFTGPALKGAKSRWADISLLYEFVKDPAAVILKDNYAKELQKKYSSMMTPSPDLSNEDIDAILYYCDTYTQ